MTILVHWGKQWNTHFQFGSACWSDGKGHIVVMAMAGGFVYMMTIWPHIILIGFKELLFISHELLFCAFWLSYFSFFKKLSFSVNKDKCILLSDIQHSHPHIIVWHVEIFLSWGGGIVHSAESLIMILLCSYLTYFNNPTSGGIVILFWIYLKYTFNNSLGKSCFPFWSSIDTLSQSLAIGDFTTFECCKIQILIEIFTLVLIFVCTLCLWIL